MKERKKERNKEQNQPATQHFFLLTVVFEGAKSETERTASRQTDKTTALYRHQDFKNTVKGSSLHVPMATRNAYNYCHLF